MVRILVTGGRDFDDTQLLFAVLDRLHQERGVTLVIHGGAKGADRLAEDWARQRGIESLTCLADWQRYGRAAGIVRNKWMLEDYQPDLVVAFPGGKGTRHMVGIAGKADTEVTLASHASLQGR